MDLELAQKKGSCLFTLAKTSKQGKTFERGTAKYVTHSNSIVIQYCSAKGTLTNMGRTKTVDNTNTLKTFLKNH